MNFLHFTLWNLQPSFSWVILNCQVSPSLKNGRRCLLLCKNNDGAPKNSGRKNREKNSFTHLYVLLLN